MVRRSPYRDEYEDEIERRPKRPRRDQRPVSRRKDTPLMLRVLSWLGVILLCFVAGYLGTSWVMDALNEKLLLKPENRVENQSDLAKLNAAVERDREEAAARSGNVQQISLKLYSVKDGRIAEPVRKSFVSRLKEDNMAEAVKSVLALSGVPGADKISVLHVFRSAETAYLDLSSAFVSALASMGQRESLLLLTAIVRTMEENFQPVVQVRFLIDSKSPSPGGPVDLTVVWKMPSRS